jgi:GH15 family glucan-1,4-alpha-glucosidase
MSSLDLAIIGNGTISALVNHTAAIVWACVPRFDGDPLFCSLLRHPTTEDDSGAFAVDLIGAVRHEQEYLPNTPILVTRSYGGDGSAIEIVDFMPRFRDHGRIFCPMTLVRSVRRIAGTPRIRVRLRPACDYGRRPASQTYGSHHIRYQVGDLGVRVTTDVPVTAVIEANVFFLDGDVTFVLGPDETVDGAVSEVGRHLFEETVGYWRGWVRSLGIPFEWQDAVIRSAITLALNAFEDTGAIVAAMTTSIPEAPNTGRNWDYRYCWLRDGYFVVDALNRLGVTRTMEQYLGYILNIVAAASDVGLQPVYGITGRTQLDERTVESLPGYRGMGPVRVGNDAFQQIQHDVYGSAILAATHLFFDRRLVRAGDEALFRRLETLGERAVALADLPDAGMWELRTTLHVHTFSSVMCWAGCDRLARISARIGLADRAAYWRDRAKAIHQEICERAWNPTLNSFVGTLDGMTLDASLLRLNDLNFLAADDPRFVGTVEAIGRNLRHGDFIHRYAGPDDFGMPQTAFLVCTFWYISALAAIGRRDEARALFEKVLACRNRHGLLAEDIDPETREQWGNFVQTYSMVGLIACALKLSVPWDEAF